MLRRGGGLFFRRRLGDFDAGGDRLLGLLPGAGAGVGIGGVGALVHRLLGAPLGGPGLVGGLLLLGDLLLLGRRRDGGGGGCRRGAGRGGRGRRSGGRGGRGGRGSGGFGLGGRLVGLGVQHLPDDRAGAAQHGQHHHEAEEAAAARPAAHADRGLVLG